MTKIPYFSLSENTGKYQARRPLTDTQIVKAAKKILSSSVTSGQAITSPTMVSDYLIAGMSNKKSEVFACVYCDSQHRIIKIEEVFQGTIDSATVHPREIARRCLDLNAAAVIFAHNHPSGSLKPSTSDKLITARLKKALALIDVRALDHFIVAGGKSFSFATHGLI